MSTLTQEEREQGIRQTNPCATCSATFRYTQEQLETIGAIELLTNQGWHFEADGWHCPND
jgi:hypothetical protein